MNRLMALFITVHVVCNCLTAYVVKDIDPKPTSSTSYCVTSDDAVPCPTRCNQTCHTLLYYTLQQEFFQSDIRLLFLSGTHNHSFITVIENVTSISFSPLYHNTTMKKPVIACSSQTFVGFVFKSVLSVSIHSLNFTGCGQEFSFGSVHHKNISNYATLAFINGGHLNIDNINISNSKSQGLMIVGIQKSVKIIRSLFTNAIHEKNDTSYIAGNSLIIVPTTANNGTFENIMIEKSSFINNVNRMDCVANGTRCKCERFAPGLSIFVYHKNVNITMNEVVFDGNLGCRGGNVAIIFYVYLVGHVLMTKCIFQNGNASLGGGMFLSFLGESTYTSSDSEYNHKLTLGAVVQISNCTFQNNSATLTGGALYINLRNSISYRHLIVQIGKGSDFTGNSLAYQGIGGVAIHYVNYFSSELKSLQELQLIIRDTTFSHNVLNNASKWNNSGCGVILLRNAHYTEIKDIAIYDNKYSGIFMVESTLIVSGQVHIHSNSGSSGGGMLFCSNSVMYLKPNTLLNISYNQVVHAGGGICIEEQCLQSKPICFFQKSNEASMNHSETNSIKVIVKNNTAGYAGDQIYGGSIAFCFIVESPKHNINDPPVQNSIEVFKKVFDIDLNAYKTTSIKSHQRRVCLCNDTTMTRNCSLRSPQHQLYPGGSFNITVAVVGQLNGTVPGTVYSNLPSQYGSVKVGDRAQKINATCQNMTYTIYSKGIFQEVVILELGIQFVGDESFAYHLSFYDTLKVPFTFNKCPIGFELSKQGDCECQSMIKAYFNCDIITKTMKLNGNKKAWIGIHGDTLLLSHGLALDYCTDQANISSDNSTIINQNSQCRFNRTGILCGRCSENFSVALGSSHCLRNCSYYHLFLIPVFAIAGLVLVILISVFNLTVAEGTTNGLIFYANVLHISEGYFFHRKHIKVLTPLLRAFIAWLNLDLGITTCLYNGMDDYAKAWLQFVFPLYIWVISGFIIILSKRFHLAANLVKRNGVKVLATLILLSYSKIIRASVNAFHAKYIHHIQIYNPQNKSDEIGYCWIMDCNVPFLEGKHTALFLVGILTCAMLLPFTLTLLFIDQLNKLSVYWCFSWVWKLKPFFDSYTGPYTNEGRFWTGLLCTTRVVLILIRNINDHETVHLNIALANAAVILFLIFPWILRSKIYRKRWLNILECSFLFNIGILSPSTLYNSKGYSWLTHLSVGIAFATFLAVSCYHVLAHVSLVQRAFWNSKLKQMKVKVWPRSKTVHPYSECDSHSENFFGALPPVVHFNQDREPLLAERDD